MAASSSRKKQDEKNLKILRELATLPSNKYCFDCNQRGPTYVDVTIGSFVCTKCSGMLRGLAPPHRVKSISMATFTPEEIDVLKNRGNDYCKSVWLGLSDAKTTLPQVGGDEQTIRDFMIEKYERKRYYLDPAQALRNGIIKQRPLTSLVSDPKPIKLNGNSSEFNRKRPEVKNLNNNNNNKVNGVKLNGFAVNFDQAFNNNGVDAQQQENFANFEDVFAGSTANSTNMPAPAAFDSYNLAQMNSFNNKMSTPTLVQPPNVVQVEDKYAALKDLDIALKTQQNYADWKSSGSNGSLYSSPTPTGSMYSSSSPQGSMIGSPSQLGNGFQVSQEHSNPFNGTGGLWGGHFAQQQQQQQPNPFRDINNWGAPAANPFKVGGSASNNPFL